VAARDGLNIRLPSSPWSVATDQRPDYRSMYAVIGGMTPWLSIGVAVSGEGEAIIACAPAMSWMSAVMATFLLPSAATWSVTFVPNDPMVAARSALPLSHRSISVATVDERLKG
jgi:hypothetical protein